MIFRLLWLAHVLGVIVWVGGMFFAHLALRPAAATVLQPPERLRLMAAALGRFFAWVEGAVVVILGAGLGMMHILGGSRGMFAVPVYVHIMFALGILMMAIFGHIRFAGYKRLAAAVAASDWAAGAKALAGIRLLVTINLVLGGLVVAIAVLGPGWVALM